MTIKINNDETPLCVLLPDTSVPPSQRRKQWDRTTRPSRGGSYESDDYVLYSARHDAAVIVSSCKSDSDSFLPTEYDVVENILIGTLPTFDKERSHHYFEEDSTDDGFIVDDDSTVSTFSSHSDDSQGKCVRFADPLVSEVRTRPRTHPDDVRFLFYSCEETQRFRQEYRLERKLLSMTDVDPAVVPNPNPLKTEDMDTVLSKDKQNSRHRISRVVVMHNDQLETFYDGLSSSSPLNSSPQFDPCGNISTSSGSDDFFDNDSFWSGSITWY